MRAWDGARNTVKGLDIYLNFIGVFEVPTNIVTLMEQEEQAVQAELSKQWAKARYKKRKAEKREFTALKKTELLTAEEQTADEERRAKRRAWQKA